MYGRGSAWSKPRAPPTVREVRTLKGDPDEVCVGTREETTHDEDDQCVDGVRNTSFARIQTGHPGMRCDKSREYALSLRSVQCHVSVIHGVLRSQDHTTTKRVLVSHVSAGNVLLVPE